MCETNYRIQSIHFCKDNMTFDQSLEWITQNKFKIKRVTETPYVYIFHQLSPTYMNRIGYTEYRCKFRNDNVCIIKGYKQ